MKRLGAGLLMALALVVAPAGAASAHPLGNFTVNTYAGLRVGADHADVEFIVDMAEIPTLQQKGRIDGGSCAPLADRLELRVDGRTARLQAGAGEVVLQPGQAGLQTLRLTCHATAALDQGDGERRVSFTNANFTDRVGWREITAVGDGATLVASDVPATSVSDRLTAYPADLLSSPLDQRSAALVVKPGGAVAAAPTAPGPARVSPLPRGLDRATQAFTSFVTRHDLTLGFAALAVLASLVLGALHAFAPGHGKTVMAAYLVGQRGTFRQAMGVAMTVTATHTVGVLALGVAISASTVVAPERVYPWLGAASGLLLAVIGVGFLVRIARRRLHDHAHTHGHAHHHHHHDHDDDQLVTTRGLVAMGFVGGLLPSPSAVVVLLGAVALGRTWFGVLLVLVYGLGMALTLAGAGLLLLRARGALDRFFGASRQNRWLTLTTRLLPPATAVFILLVGVYLAVRGAAQI